MYKSIQHYDRVQRRKFRQAKELHKKLLVCFIFLVIGLILALKAGEILDAEYCEDRQLGAVNEQVFNEYCKPGDGLKHRK